MITNCLWIGGKLSTMEKLALRSHLKVGHECHLWTYGDAEGVPNGIVVEDGNEILSKDEIFVYQTSEGKGSVSAFSNLFRYKLIYERGGWWCDTDVVCLKEFNFDTDYVLSSEATRKGHAQTASCVFKCPRKSDLMKYCLDVVYSKEREKLVWGEIGPLLINEASIMTGTDRYCQPPSTFCPIHWFDAPKIVTENRPIPDSHAIHLWNEIWRRESINKDGNHPAHCVYERLKNVVLSNE